MSKTAEVEMIPEVVEVQPVSVTEAQQRAEIDIQVNTAKRFPRHVKRAIDNCIALVTSNKEFAEECIYSLPRGGKKIEGASVHLARLIASEYKNLTIAARIIDVGEKEVTAQGVAIDLENNYRSSTETRRRIVDKNGQRYNDDMIIMTCNAAMAIAVRNAIYNVIPSHVVKPIYNSARKVLLGDMSTEQKRIKRRKEVLDGFLNTYNVTEDEILKMLELETVNQINEDHLVTLIGLAQAIKDGDTTVVEAFGRNVDHITKETQEKIAEVIHKANEKRNGQLSL